MSSKFLDSPATKLKLIDSIRGRSAHHSDRVKVIPRNGHHLITARLDSLGIELRLVKLSRGRSHYLG
ncbi:hypothetical protein NG791_22990 [Laspinema sp. D1]|uniref:hypothetical protein n=1 Tax=Laspinema palackyanum TaxID=3231601 RepID=UPI003483E0BA|nr:hypothetical protein [Laspinema sp. D2b]